MRVTISLFSIAAALFFMAGILVDISIPLWEIAKALQ